jgi:hypothetical protein
MTSRIPSYYVVMRDYGSDGREAVVDPEVTRREVISRVASGEYKDILFIHHIVPGEIPEDVTNEIMDAAGVPDVVTGPPRLSPSERLEAMRDLVSSYRKNSEAV